MPYSASRACSCFAAATASPRHAFSQPVSRMRCPAPAFTIHSRCSFSRCADQSVQRGRPRPETRAGRIGQKARDPSGILRRPNRIPAQCRVAVGQVFRQRLPQRGIVERRYRAAADDAGIAIGGLAARLAPVDENDRHPALARGIGCRYADDARAEHHDINCFFRHWLSRHCHGRISHHGPPANSRHPAREFFRARTWHKPNRRSIKRVNAWKRDGETHRSMARTSLKAPCLSGNLESQSSIFGSPPITWRPFSTEPINSISTEVHLQ